jgi:hypothetical protein
MFLADLMRSKRAGYRISKSRDSLRTSQDRQRRKTGMRDAIKRGVMIRRHRIILQELN